MNTFVQLRSQFFLISILLCMVKGFCCAQVSQKAYQTIVVGDTEVLKIAIEGAVVEVKPTKGRRVLVETSVVLSVPNQALLDFVVKKGRYNLDQMMDAANRTFSLASPKGQNVIIVKGEECEERISYIVYVPEGIRVDQLGSK